MAHQIQRDRVFGNFKPPKHKRKAPKSDARAKRPGMSDDHLSCIRQLPCACCLKTPAGEAHHLKQDIGGERGMGLRATDRWTVPLCRLHHDEVERAGSRNEGAFFEGYKIESAPELAAALWLNTGDVPAMTRVLLTHKALK